ncbi:MAG: bifunctional nicotinamidase/pyrazinamidase [Janthinobacterium lividum]
MQDILPNARCALIVVDVQNGFTPGGNLAVANGDQVVPVINRLAPAFENIVITQDWHPAGHISFVSSHPGRQPFEIIDVAYGPQVLWPEHCIQGSSDAALRADLDLPTAQMVIRKGYRRDIDSYSAFEEADHRTGTGLAGYLRERGIDTVYIVGLATDYCVAWTAMDARKFGFAAAVIEDATRGIDINGSVNAAWERMLACGVERIASSRIRAA